MVAIPASSLSATLLLEDFDGSGQFFAGFGANVFVTEGLKRLIHRDRPDGSDGKSFPSGHTSIAVQGAVFIHRRYGPSYAAPAYLGAAVVAFSRVHARKHFLTDVLTGAALGTLSSYFLTDRRPSETGDGELGLGFGLQASYGLGLPVRLSGGVVPVPR